MAKLLSQRGSLGFRLWEFDLEATTALWYANKARSQYEMGIYPTHTKLLIVSVKTREYRDISAATYDVFGRRGIGSLIRICSDRADTLSTDHRGTPGKPGRVMTVIEREFWETLNDPIAHLETPFASSKAAVYGAAYHIPASHAEEVHDYLDEREIDGYTVHYTSFYPTDPNNPTATPTTCMVYIGLPTNPQFLRDPAQREPQDVAEVISKGHGQSGKNSEYLYMLEKALEGLGLGSADLHVTDLVRRVKGIEKEVADVEEKMAERSVRRSLSISDAEAHVGFPRTE